MAIIAVAAAAAANAAFAYRPKIDFQLNCMGCHLADGSGEAGRVPSIRRTLLLFSESPQGRNYVLRVPGVAESPLSDAATAALLNWMVRHLSDVALPRGFVDYSAAEVRRARAHPLADVSRARARLLRAAAAMQQRPRSRRAPRS
ncbi:MAG TPA: hypothetical protein VMV25_01125 [Steroidobacteraceae bacterium]|nr:hypothetical protein [Steroidobacteraceae bacterium]